MHCRTIICSALPFYNLPSYSALPFYNLPSYSALFFYSTLLCCTASIANTASLRFTLSISCSIYTCQEKEACLKREQDDLSRAKDRWQRERNKAADDSNQDLRTALRRAEADRWACGAHFEFSFRLFILPDSFWLFILPDLFL